MDLGLHNKVAVITGASKGIGFATAKQFLQEGAKVAICARNEEDLAQAASALSPNDKVFFRTVDTTNSTAVQAFAAQVYQHFGALDCWVNNVGAPVSRKDKTYTAHEIDTACMVNFHSVVYGCEAAFHYMKQTGGSIVNVSSLAARCGTAGRSTLYGPLKSAVVALAATFSGEYAAYGIRVNAVLPGFTLTPAVRATIDPQELQKNEQECLLHRLAAPEEIAAPIVFLCSQAASYITGTSLEVSGGRATVLNPDFSYQRKNSEQTKL